MPATFAEIEKDADYQSLPEIEKLEVKKQFFEKVISKDTDYLSLDDSERQKAQNIFIGLIPKKTFSEQALVLAKKAITPIMDIKEPAQRALETQRPLQTLTRAVIASRLPEAVRPFVRRIPITPEQTIEQIGIETGAPSLLDIATLGLGGISKASGLIGKAPAIAEEAVKAGEKAAGTVPKAISLAKEAATQMRILKEEAISGSEVFTNPNKLKEITDPILKIKTLEETIDSALKFARSNPDAKLVREKTKQISERLAEAIETEDVLTDTISKFGKEDFATILREARTTYGRGLNKLSQLAKIAGPQTDLENKLRTYVPDYLDKTIELFTAFKLTNPYTYLRNTAGNTLAALTRASERTVMGGLDFFKSTVTNKPREVFAEEAAYGIWEGIKKGVPDFFDAFTKGKFGKTQEIAGREAISGKLGEVVRIPFKILGATDEMFKTILRTQEIHAQAFRQAVLEGLTGSKRVAKIQEIVSNPSESILKHADEVAKEFTFNDTPEYVKKLESARNSLPGLKLIIPFLRTPANISRFVIKRTPLGLLRRTGIDLSMENLARVINGSLLGGAMTMAASEGYITGAPPKNERDRKILFSAGWKPYSVKIGDNYHSYLGFEPISAVLAQAADIAQISNKGKNEPPGDKVEQITFSIARNLIKQPFLTGLNDLMQAIDNPEREGEKFLERFAGGLVPTGVVAAARAIDPTLRKPEGILESIQSRLPFISKKVPAARSIFGEEIKRTPQSKPDSLTQKMSELGLSIAIPKKGGDLTREQFDELQKISGGLIKKTLEPIILNPGFIKLSSEQQQDFIDKIVSQIRRSSSARLKAVNQ